MSQDGVPTEQYVAYQAARARGGAGLQITGITPIHATGGLGDHGMIINMDERVIPGYQRVSTAVHEAGGCILAQLGHSAATLKSYDPLTPAWSASAITGDLSRQVPHVMSIAEIDEMVAAYEGAAGRVREGGMDGVELLVAFGFRRPRSCRRIRISARMSTVEASITV